MRIQSAQLVQRASSALSNMHLLPNFSYNFYLRYICSSCSLSGVSKHSNIASVLINRQREEITREDGLELRKWRLNRALLILRQYCLNLLWSFSERPQDREFVLSKKVLPLVIDALLLPYPFPVEEYALNFHPLDLMVVRVNEAAIGCFGG